MLIARGRLKHQYPHSWRSKKPVIFRNTPQWFIAMDKDIAGRRRHAAPSRARRDQGDALGAGAGREPHQRHDREPARLGDLAPARLGRADHGVRQARRRRLGRNPATIRRSMRASSRRSSRKAPMPGMRRARASAFSARAPTRAGRRSTTSSTSGSIPARPMPSCWRTRKHFPGLAAIKRKADGGPETVMYLEGSDQHRGWFQSSLLGKLRHPRPRAVRRRAHPRLRARRGRLQNVEVARQRDRAAGRDQAFRRRHPAHVGVRRRLCRRSAHRPGNPQNHRRDLSQAAQHAALDAGQSGAFRGRR